MPAFAKLLTIYLQLCYFEIYFMFAQGFPQTL